MADKCEVFIPEVKYFNDILHPCIRYNPEGFKGHKWWMIASPWYDRNDKIENPILFYGDEEADGSPPLKWHYDSIIKETPETGYNSDPNIVYTSDGLQVIWREVNTPKAKDTGFFSIVVAKWIKRSGEMTEEILLSGECSEDNLTDLCPIVLMRGNEQELYTAYHDKRAGIVKRILCKCLRLLGIKRYARQTRFIVKRSGQNFNKMTMLPIYFDKSHIPWHFDLVQWQDRTLILMYCEFENHIYIGEVTEDKVIIDNIPLTKDLVINDTYKPTAVLKDDILWLYYTDKTSSDKKLNELFRIPIRMSDIPFIRRSEDL